MKLEIVPRPDPMPDGLKMIPESDVDILTIGKIINKANPSKVSMDIENGHLSYGYISLPELINVAGA